jgi:hypothetical protein
MLRKIRTRRAGARLTAGHRRPSSACSAVTGSSRWRVTALSEQPEAKQTGTQRQPDQAARNELRSHSDHPR